jgi:hypothetical protein
MMRFVASPMQIEDSASSDFRFSTSPNALVALQCLAMTSADQNRLERRCGQRFPYQVPVLLRVPNESRSGSGFTQDLSSRGAMIWTDLQLAEGEWIDMTLVMPSEITLAEDMNVCCRARIVRREQAECGKPAVAVHIEHYEFLHRETPLEGSAAKDIPLARI